MSIVHAIFIPMVETSTSPVNRAKPSSLPSYPYSAQQSIHTFLPSRIILLDLFHQERYNSSMNDGSVAVSLAEITASQWGMVTTAQAERVGVSRLMLARLNEQGLLDRLRHGVYLDAGAPGSQFDELKAAWLSTVPARFAEERLKNMESGPVVSGESASRLHGVGDLRAMVNTFTVPTRKQSQKREIQYRMRTLDPRDVTLFEGLPTTTLERTIADLIDMRTDLSLVADVLADAVKRTLLDHEHLVELLSPLAVRNGFKKADGQALLDKLLVIAGLDFATLVDQLIHEPGLGEILREKLSVGDAIRQVAQDMRVLHVESPEVFKEITANLQKSNQVANLGITGRAIAEQYQRTATATGLSKQVREILNVTSLQFGKPKSPHNLGNIAGQKPKTGVNDVRR